MCFPLHSHATPRAVTDTSLQSCSSLYFSVVRKQPLASSVYHSAVSEATRFLAPGENDGVLTAAKGMNFYEALLLPPPPSLSEL